MGCCYLKGLGQTISGFFGTRIIFFRKEEALSASTAV
jgi:hypothetical protein